MSKKIRVAGQPVYAPKPSSKAVSSYATCFPRVLHSLENMNRGLAKTNPTVQFNIGTSNQTELVIVAEFKGKVALIGRICVKDGQFNPSPFPQGSWEQWAILELCSKPKGAKLPYTRVETLSYNMMIDKKGWKLPANSEHGRTGKYSEVVGRNEDGSKVVQREFIPPSPILEPATFITGTTTTNVPVKKSGLQGVHPAVDKLHRVGNKARNINGQNPNGGGKKGRGISRIQATSAPDGFTVDTIDRREQTALGYCFQADKGVN